MAPPPIASSTNSILKKEKINPPLREIYSKVYYSLIWRIKISL